jgi:hypothetical protein
MGGDVDWVSRDFPPTPDAASLIETENLSRVRK